MKPSEDVFGQALLDHYLGKEVYIVIERDDGYLGISAEPGLYFQKYSEWKPYEQAALQEATGSILDLGCGVGRHAIYLQGQGHRVLGLDSSPLAIRVARERGLRESVVLPVTRVSSNLGKFETVLMMGNNFGLFGNRKRARWLLKRLYGMTSTDARIIATSLNPYDTEESIHLAYHQRNRQRDRMPGQVRIRIRYGILVGKWFDYLLVSADEMRELVNSAGWRVAEVIESDDPTYAAIIEK